MVKSPPADTSIGSLICTKLNCGKPRAGTRAFCKEHLAEYHRTYEAGRELRAAQKGFAQGVDITRRMLAWEFARHGNRSFSGKEIAFAIENAPRPVYQAGE